MNYSVDLPALGPYSGQSLEDLVGLEGTNRVDIIAWPLSEKARAGRPLSEPEQTVVSVEKLHTDAYNAGFDGFFTNSWSDVTRTEAALKAIGRRDAAALLTGAMAALSVSPDAAHDEVLDALEDESAQDQLDDLDEQYTALAWSVTTSLFDYIKANASQIQLK